MIVDSFYKRISKIMFYLFLITCSFDLLLNIEFHGLHFRIGMLFLMIAELFAFFEIIKRGKVLIPCGGFLLIGLLFLNGLFCFHSPNFMRAAGYELWFIVLVGGVFLAHNIFITKQEKLHITRIFLLQFVGMAVLGYVQFFVGLFGKSFFTAQWTKFFIPRLNGLTYEPSYYATYMLIGWVFFAYSFEKQDTSVLSRKQIFISLILTSGAIVLSTSRMGWLMLFLWCLFRFVWCALKNRKALVRIICILAILCMFVFLIVFITGLEKPVVEYFRFPVSSASDQFAAGMYNGYENSSDYAERYFEESLKGSSYTRLTSMIILFKVFVESPLIGYSLGGVLSASVAAYPDVILRLEQPNAGLLAEMLASFGIVGFLAVMIYLILLIKNVAKRYSVDRNTTQVGWLWSLIWVLGILQFNNNILRLYVWALIAVLCTYLSSDYVLGFGKNVRGKEKGE